MRRSDRVLHVINGDSAAERIRASGLAGDVLPWRDVLHEGPVPAGISEPDLRSVRARFLAESGWADEGAVRIELAERDWRLEASARSGEALVLWFESDLYDQLQLAQVLWLLGRGTTGTVRLVQVSSSPFVGLGELHPGDFPPLFEHAGEVTDAQLALARAAWDAFRSPDPVDVLELLTRPTGALPFLRDALVRLLEQYPWLGTGLGRTEWALLAAVADGADTPEAAFVAQEEQEERPFLGDSTAFAYLRRLASGPSPLLEGDLALTRHGRAVLAGEVVWSGQPDRRLGGVHLSGGLPEWCWNPRAQSLVSVRSPD